VRSLIRFALFGALAATAFAQAPIEVEIVGTAANHQLSWTTTVNYNYQVFMSPDLETWIDTGIAEQGNGSTITYGLMSTADKLFYRIHETADPYNGGFLVLPGNNDEVDLIDGVCFSFNLDVFSALPAKIRIYQRDYNSGDPWEQIGQITDFDEIDGIKFVRGSAVWLPDAEGEYEIQAAAVDGTGTVIASAVRHVTVGSNQAPSITITSGPTTPSALRQAVIFTAIATDADGDDVRRVEFYDNGILIGTDATPDETSPGVFEFGDDIQDIEGNYYDLLKGTHDITAKAFDSRGAIGETASASQYVITGGNSRSTIAVTSPANGLIVTQGQSFTVVYTEGDPDGASDIDEVEAYDIVTFDGDIDTASPFDDFTIDTTGWEPGSHTIRVVTRDVSGDESYPLYLTVFVRTGSGATFAETLVASIVDEATAAPSAEIFTGVEASSGLFESGFDSGLELDSGALLTTGSFIIWNGGDADTYAGENMDEGYDSNFGINNEEPGDPDLEVRVTGDTTFDAASLEFDVFCSNGQLELEFQLGSEEYIEWVGDYNDGFMVTVDGVLVTLVPDCSDILAVNSVHPEISTEFPAINEHLYLDDDADIDPRVDPVNQPEQVEYDGMTIRLRAHAFVTPNTTHSIKIVIADVDDDTRDSGVFIGESSVRTIAPQP
jgi:hypothetical protein